MVETQHQFSAAYRLHTSRQFETIYKSGVRVHKSVLVLYGKFNTLGFHRLGITVSRKIGGSVVRNRVKRRVREIFRTRLKSSGLGIDVIVNAKRPIAEASFSQIERELLSAFLRLNQLLTQDGPVAQDLSETPN